MKKSRILSLLIAVVFVLSTVSIPAFAATQFKYSQPDPTYVGGQSFYKAPIEGHPYHYAFTVEDPDAPDKEYTYEYYVDTALGGDAQYNSTAYAQISDNGLFTLAPHFNGITDRVFPAYKVTATNKNDPSEVLIGSKNYNYMYPSVDLDFEDGIATGLTNGEIKIDETTENRYYAKTEGQTSIKFDGTYFLAAHTTNLPKYSVPVVFEFSTDSLQSSGLKFGNAAILTPSTTTIPAGWNNYKVVVYTHGENQGKLDIYMNDKLIVDDHTHATHTNANLNLFYLSADRVDNVKCYSTSLGFPYNVTVTAPATHTVGSKVTASALRCAMPTSNIPEDIYTSLYIADSAEGPYTSLNATELTLDESHEGKFIKAGAYVQETELCNHASKIVYSDPVQIKFPAQPIAWKETPQFNKSIENGKQHWIFAPQMEGDVFEVPIEITGGSSFDSITWQIRSGCEDYFNDPDSIVLRTVNGNNRKAILSVSNPDLTIFPVGAASITYVNQPIQVKYTDGALVSPFQRISEQIKRTFEDGVTIEGGTVVLDETTGNHYITCDIKSSYKFRPVTTTEVNAGIGTIAIDYEMKVGGEINTMWSTPINWKDGFYLSELAGNPGYVYDRAASGAPVYVGEGWKHVRLYLDLPNATYSLFVDGKAVTVNRNVGLVDPAKDAKLNEYIDFQGELDDYTYGHVTIKTPTAYNAKINNPAVDKAIKADYDFFCGAFYDDANISEIKYYISDSINGNWEEIPAGYEPDANDLGRYVKAVITPKVNYYHGEVYTGAVVETAPAKIGDVNIGAITLSVNGNVANMADAAIIEAITEDVTSATVTLTVPASCASGKDVKFILAQYSPVWNNITNIAVVNSTLAAAEHNVEITLNATDINEFSYFKLFILTSDGLVPVNSVVNLR